MYTKSALIFWHMITMWWVTHTQCEESSVKNYFQNSSTVSNLPGVCNPPLILESFTSH